LPVVELIRQSSKTALKLLNCSAEVNLYRSFRLRPKIFGDARLFVTNLYINREKAGVIGTLAGRA
jgi:hypothetical protein